MTFRELWHWVVAAAQTDVKRIWRPLCGGCFSAWPYCMCEDIGGTEYLEERSRQLRSLWKRFQLRLIGLR